MSATNFTPAFSIRLLPEVCIEHGADKLLQLLRRSAVQQNVDHEPIVIGEAQAGEDTAGVVRETTGVKVSALNDMGKHGYFRFHRRFILSLGARIPSVAEAGERPTLPGGRGSAAE